MKKPLKELPDITLPRNSKKPLMYPWAKLRLSRRWVAHARVWICWPSSLIFGMQVALVPYRWHKRWISAASYSGVWFWEPSPSPHSIALLSMSRWCEKKNIYIYIHITKVGIVGVLFPAGRTACCVAGVALCHAQYCHTQLCHTHNVVTHRHAHKHTQLCHTQLCQTHTHTRTLVVIYRALSHTDTRNIVTHAHARSSITHDWCHTFPLYPCLTYYTDPSSAPSFLCPAFLTCSALVGRSWLSSLKKKMQYYA